VFIADTLTTKIVTSLQMRWEENFIKRLPSNSRPSILWLPQIIKTSPFKMQAF
jgi:hypothetical protein